MNARAAWLLAFAALPACGTNLLVVRADLELRTTEGRIVQLELDWRPPRGLVHDLGSTVPEVLFGVLAEPCDLLVSTGIAIDAMFRSDRTVTWGPLGWLASLTPFATLVPGIDFPPRARGPIDAATLQAMLTGDAEHAGRIARTLLQDDRIVAARVRDHEPE